MPPGGISLSGAGASGGLQGDWAPSGRDRGINPDPVDFCSVTGYSKGRENPYIKRNFHIKFGEKKLKAAL